jgi:methanogenic corrinoid protein MtbC1
MMMESKGLKVINLGNNVPPEKYIEAAIEHNADIIACSALLTTTMVQMKEVVSLLAESSLAGKTKVMIGGAPVNQAYCDTIGAHGFAPDATLAAEKAVALCAELRA